jgi:hypothetical protein
MPIPILSNLLGLGQKNPQKIPEIHIDPTKVQAQAISGNIANAPAAFDLASMANRFSADELNKSLERMLPGYSALRDKGTETISSFMRGEIPQDVQDRIERKAAESGVASGTSGSQFNKFDKLRNLGFTSLDITREGLKSASSWIASAPKAPQFDFTSMFFSPQQRLGFEFNQAQANTGVQKYNSWAGSLPSPEQAALGGFVDWIGDIGQTTAEAFVGGKLKDWLKPKGLDGSSGSSDGLGQSKWYNNVDKSDFS